MGWNRATGVIFVSSMVLTGSTPAGRDGPQNVRVINSDGQRSMQLSGAFTYFPPTVTGIAPTMGPVAGGTMVTIMGTYFASPATVTIGGAMATGVTFVSDTTLTAMTPAGLAGAANVTVTNPDVRSHTLTGGFTYF